MERSQSSSDLSEVSLDSTPPNNLQTFYVVMCEIAFQQSTDSWFSTILNMLIFVYAGGMVGYGIETLSRCPIAPNVPLTLAIFGGTFFVVKAFSLLDNFAPSSSKIVNFLGSMATLTNFVTICVVSAYVYPAWSKYSADPKNAAEYCDDVAMKLAFWTTTAAWSCTGVMFILLFFACSVICVKEIHGNLVEVILSRLIGRRQRANSSAPQV